MEHVTIEERMIPAADLPDYVGWTLNGARRTDGVLAWGLLESAEVQGDAVSIVHTRHVSARTSWQSVPDGAFVALTDPMGRPHMVTVSRGIRSADA